MSQYDPQQQNVQPRPGNHWRGGKESDSIPSCTISRHGSKSITSTILSGSAIVIVLFISKLLGSLSAQSTCETIAQPNLIATQYPDMVTGNLNGTTMIIPIDISLAQGLVSQYPILERSYRSLLPSLPPGKYPLMVTTKHDHDLQLFAYNLTLADFSVSVSFRDAS